MLQPDNKAVIASKVMSRNEKILVNGLTTLAAKISPVFFFSTKIKMFEC